MLQQVINLLDPIRNTLHSLDFGFDQNQLNPTYLHP
jgi:hypothetical protein